MNPLGDNEMPASDMPFLFPPRWRLGRFQEADNSQCRGVSFTRPYGGFINTREPGRFLHFRVARSNSKNSRSRTIWPIPLPRSVNRSSEANLEFTPLCGNPAPRSFDAPDPLAKQPPKPRPVPGPIPLGPVPSPLGILSPPYLIPRNADERYCRVLFQNPSPLAVGACSCGKRPSFQAVSALRMV